MSARVVSSRSLSMSPWGSLEDPSEKGFVVKWGPRWGPKRMPLEEPAGCGTVRAISPWIEINLVLG